MLVASLQYQFTKDGLNYASPFVLMSLRFLVVGAIFYFAGGGKLSFDRDTLKIAIFASISTGLWATGLQYVSPGDSAVLSYTMPLFSIPIAYFTIKESVSIREVLGAIVGFSGVVLYSLTLNHGSLLIGAIFTVLNAIFWAAYSTYYRKLRDRDPIPILTTQFLVGSIPLIIGSFFSPRFIPSTNLFFDLIYVVVFTGVIQYYLWNGLLRRGRVGRITTLALRSPCNFDPDRQHQIINDTRLHFNNWGGGDVFRNLHFELERGEKGEPSSQLERCFSSEQLRNLNLSCLCPSKVLRHLDFLDLDFGRFLISSVLN